MLSKSKRLIGMLAAVSLTAGAFSTISLCASGNGYIVPVNTSVIIDTGSQSGAADETPEKLPYPFVITFGAESEFKKKGRFVTFGDGTEGKYTFEDGALKLSYLEHSDLSAYRAMPTVLSGFLESEHRYIRVTYKTDEKSKNELTLMNNANGHKVTLSPDTSASGGEYTVSNVCEIKTNGILGRYMSGVHCALEWNCQSSDSAIYIKEIAFFGSIEQAYEYYGDAPKVSAAQYSVMTFGEGGNAEIFHGDESQGQYYGNSSVNSDGSVGIRYAERTNYDAPAMINYMSKVKFKTGGGVSLDRKYVRVLYKAKNPDGVSRASLIIGNDATSQMISLIDRIPDTDGEYVLSDTALISDAMLIRMVGGTPLHVSMVVNTSKPGGEYDIKAVYFFDNREGADSFSTDSKTCQLTVAGNDIADYRIVIAEDASASIKLAAKNAAEHIKALTGATLETVYDSESPTRHEIVIGYTNREGSDEAVGAEEMYAYGKLVGESYIVSGSMNAAVSEGISQLLDRYLYRGSTSVPEKIAITSDSSFKMPYGVIEKYSIWDEAVNVDIPDIIKTDFESDDGLFSKDSDCGWKVSNGKLVSSGTGSSAYVNVYEPNARIDAVINVSNAGKDGDAAVMLRYVSDEAYVRAGYDFARGEWYIESREGADFFPVRVAAKKSDFKYGADYRVSFAADGGKASLAVNGERILTADGIDHVTPGRAAVYAVDSSVSIDSVKLVLMSGEGAVIKNVSHTVLPDEIYREGGSVTELAGGKLVYTHNSSAGFESTDGGVTWVRTEKWTNTEGNSQILRLNNGSLIKIGASVGKLVSWTSVDEGKTWTLGGTIPAAAASNMNDKITQSKKTGRIFYTLNYEVPVENAVDGHIVWCELAYSDDSGKTWKKTDFATYKLKGCEDQAYFGECKIIECDDGTLRMYSSWNEFGCIVYSESKDNGMTWGPIVKMESFVCARSSMQLVRDAYADNDSTYYMVFAYSELDDEAVDMGRPSLTLAKSENGKDWKILGDVWRWESGYRGTDFNTHLVHMVDPFIKVTEERVLVGSGISEYLPIDGAGDNTYHFAQRQHIWSIEKDTLGEGDDMSRFADIAPAAPYREAVEYVADAGLFNGVSETEFAPDTAMSRAMFVTVLGRFEGVDASKYGGVSFNDAVSGSWYAPYVEWASKNGVVNGYGNGVFGVNDSVTVEQAILILARYCEFKASDSKTGVKLADFTDSGDVSDYAKQAVEWAVENGIYEGSDGVLSPKKPATRALVATVFARFADSFGV